MFLFDAGAEAHFIAERLVQELSLVQTPIQSSSVVGFDGYQECEVSHQVLCLI